MRIYIGKSPRENGTEPFPKPRLCLMKRFGNLSAVQRDLKSGVRGLGVRLKVRLVDRALTFVYTYLQK